MCFNQSFKEQHSKQLFENQTQCIGLQCRNSLSERSVPVKLFNTDTKGTKLNVCIVMVSLLHIEIRQGGCMNSYFSGAKLTFYRVGSSFVQRHNWVEFVDGSCLAPRIAFFFSEYVCFSFPEKPTIENFISAWRENMHDNQIGLVVAFFP